MRRVRVQEEKGKQKEAARKGLREMAEGGKKAAGGRKCEKTGYFSNGREE